MWAPRTPLDNMPTSAWSWSNHKLIWPTEMRISTPWHWLSRRNPPHGQCWHTVDWYSYTWQDPGRDLPAYEADTNSQDAFYYIKNIAKLSTALRLEQFFVIPKCTDGITRRPTGIVKIIQVSAQEFEWIVVRIALLRVETHKIWRIFLVLFDKVGHPDPAWQGQHLLRRRNVK